MSIVTLPANLPVKRQDFGIQFYDMTFTNDDTGSNQTHVQAPMRRTCTLVSEDRIPVPAEAALWTVLVHALRGQVNQLAVYDVLKPAPRGTARGAWTAQAAPAGASTIVIQAGVAQAGKTLLQGDWIGVNQDTVGRQLLHVQADAVVDGAGLLAVQFEAVLRRPVTAGAAVVWDRPTCLMRRADTKSTWSNETRTQGGFSLDLIERWEQ